MNKIKSNLRKLNNENTCDHEPCKICLDTCLKSLSPLESVHFSIYDHVNLFYSQTDLQVELRLAYDNIR